MVSIEVIRNNNARKFDQYCRIHRNCVRLGRNQSKEHFMAICGRAYDEWSKGKSILTEALLDDGKARADIFVLDDGIAIEKVVSEKEDSLYKKFNIWNSHGFMMEIF